MKHLKAANHKAEMVEKVQEAQEQEAVKQVTGSTVWDE